MADLSPSSDLSGHRISSWRLFFLLDLFLLSLLILSTRLATFLHETVGHALTAALFGGRVTGIRLSLFGGGNVYRHFDGSLSLPAAFLARMARVAGADGVLTSITRRPASWSAT